MAEPTLTTEEKSALLNQSDSDAEYEDATDEVPSDSESLSKRLHEQLTVSAETCQQKMADGADSTAESTETEQKLAPSASAGNQEFFSDPVNSALSADTDSSGTDATEDLVAAAMKDAGDLDSETKKDAEKEVVIDEDIIKEREAAMTEEEREVQIVKSWHIVFVARVGESFTENCSWQLQ